LNAEPPDDAAKRVVVDANALIALIAREPESDAVTVHFAGWISDRVELHAPELARYEIANALTRKVSHSEVQADDLPPCGRSLTPCRSPTTHSPTESRRSPLPSA
jgi:hypothetical protein